MPTHLRSALIVLVLAAAAPTSTALGQAWVGNQHEADASLDYSLNTSTTILQEGEQEFDNLDLGVHSMVLSGGYNPIDRLGLSVSLPFVMSKYSGEPRGAHGSYDDGDSHATLQDLAFRARYQVIEELAGFAFSPHLGFLIPVADYEVYGNASAGRHIKSLLVGGSLGRMLDPLLPRAYVHVAYELAIGEKFDEQPEQAEYKQLRSSWNLLLGYFITPGIEVNLGLDIDNQLDGVDFVELTGAHPLALTHDPVLNEDRVNAGGGGSWYITDTLRLAATARVFVSGKNTRKSKMFGLGLSYDFH